MPNNNRVIKIIPHVLVLLCCLVLSACCSMCGGASSSAAPASSCSSSGCSYDTASCNDCCACPEPPEYKDICEPDTCCEREVKSYGIQIIKVGDQRLIIIPSDKAFLQNTPVVDPDYYCALNKLACYLSKLNKLYVKVEGYTNCTGCPPREFALTRQQAQVIESYLWNRGIDARFVYAVGYGALNPVATNCTAYGRAENRRIELHIRLITDCWDH